MTMKSALRVLGIIFIAGGFASFLFGISFYDRNLPNKPQPELGRIYSINNHGLPLYLTKHEELEQTWSFILAGVLGVSAGIIDRLFDSFDRRKLEMLPKRRAPWNHRWGP
jgi:hypothetical protein